MGSSFQEADSSWYNIERRHEQLRSAFNDPVFQQRWEQHVGGASKYHNWLVSAPGPDGGTNYEIPTHLVFDALPKEVQGEDREPKLSPCCTPQAPRPCPCCPAACSSLSSRPG